STSRIPCPPATRLFPYTTLFRSHALQGDQGHREEGHGEQDLDQAHAQLARTSPLSLGHDRAYCCDQAPRRIRVPCGVPGGGVVRSEEHTSELQSRGHLVCRLLLE